MEQLLLLRELCCMRCLPSGLDLGGGIQLLAQVTCLLLGRSHGGLELLRALGFRRERCTCVFEHVLRGAELLVAFGKPAGNRLELCIGLGELLLLGGAVGDPIGLRDDEGGNQRSSEAIRGDQRS